jgi:hypothetical protein
LNRPFRRRLAGTLAAVFALGLWPAAARAWTYSEHRQITARGIETLDPQRQYEITGGIIDHAIYDSLLTFKGADVTHPLPSVAASYKASKDAKTIFANAWSYALGDSNPNIGVSFPDAQHGWMVGVGVEYAFTPNWSVKAEYNYLDLGTRRETLQPVPANCPGCGPFQYDIRQRMDLVKIGVNYRFGWAGPVVAKY